MSKLFVFGCSYSEDYKQMYNNFVDPKGSTLDKYKEYVNKFIGIYRHQVENNTLDEQELRNIFNDLAVELQSEIDTIVNRMLHVPDHET